MATVQAIVFVKLLIFSYISWSSVADQAPAHLRGLRGRQEEQAQEAQGHGGKWSRQCGKADQAPAHLRGRQEEEAQEALLTCASELRSAGSQRRSGEKADDAK